MEEKDWNLIAQQAVLEDEAFDELYEHLCSGEECGHGG